MVKPKPENIEIGKRIKAVRIAQGKDLASFSASITPPASASIASRWERGINLPNNKRLQSIAKQSGISVDYLLHGSDKSMRETAERIISTNFDDQHSSIPDKKIQAATAILLDHLNEHDVDKIRAIQDSVSNEKLASYDTSSLDLITSGLSLINVLQESSSPDIVKQLSELFRSLTISLDPAATRIKSQNPQLKKQLETSFNNLIHSLYD